MKYIDNFLNSITMYRLVLYVLCILATVSIFFGFAGLLPFTGPQFTISAAVLLAACYLVNYFFSNLYKIPRNSESSLITALILFLILAPPGNLSGVLTLLLASVLAMGSKYLATIKKEHLFNPAAFAAVVLGLLGNHATIWWVATPYLFPFTLILGLLIVRKLRRFLMFFAFISSALISVGLFGLSTNWLIFDHLIEIATSWPLIFFGTVMFTEPLTTPPTRKLQTLYGMVVGLFFGFPFRLGPLNSTPELALIAGNIFSFLASPKQRLKLKLQKKGQIGEDIYNFSFASPQKLQYAPGQYLEWTLPSPHSDSRGNRRYFTIASSPTEGEIKLGVKISPDRSSSFKKNLLLLNSGDEVFAAQLSGDFILPHDKNKKLVFIAGGIGITPFRSMIQYLVDTNQRRDIVLFYTSSSAGEFVYKDLFEKAKKLGLKVVYVMTNKENAPSSWLGHVGRLTPEIIQKEAQDYRQRMFYLSGPEAMVAGYKKLLKSLGISRGAIRTDYFPGY